MDKKQRPFKVLYIEVSGERLVESKVWLIRLRIGIIGDLCECGIEFLGCVNNGVSNIVKRNVKIFIVSFYLNTHFYNK